MIEVFLSGGFMMWPMLLIGVGILVLVVRAAVDSREVGRSDAVVRRTQSIVFWGAMSLVLGLLGTVVGVIQMASAIERIGQVSETLLWGGIRVTMVTLVFGLLLFALSLFSWYALRGWAVSDGVAAR